MIVMLIETYMRRKDLGEYSTRPAAEGQKGGGFRADEIALVAVTDNPRTSTLHIGRRALAIRDT